jgi:hypothetical protein
MNDFVRDLALLIKSLPQDTNTTYGRESSYREVVSHQAIFVTLTIALMAYITKEPTFQIHVDVLFAVMATIPLLGLFHIVRGRVRTAEGDFYLYAQPVRSYARQAFLFDVLIVGLVSYLYWQGQLPGQ